MSLRCLVLDQGYQPHRVVSWQRAITMLFREVVEIIEEYDEEIKSVTFIMKAPAVIRLLNRVRRKRGVKFSRVNVLTRDNFRCQYCGQKKQTKNLNYDHVIPRSQGGKTIWENIVTSCYNCNDKKGGRTPLQAKMKLIKNPIRPKSLPIAALHLVSGESYPEVWNNYCYWHGELEK